MKRRTRTALVLAAACLSPAPAPAQAPEEERPLAEVAWPAEKSPTPKAAEWSTAPRVKPTRASEAAAACRLYAYRGWIRVRCPGEAFAVSLLAGEPDVAFWIDPKTHEGEVMMPVRPGSKHVAQMWTASKDAAGAFLPVPHFVVQQHWIPGAKAPVVTIF